MMISQVAKLVVLLLLWDSAICLSSDISTGNSIKGHDLNNFSSDDDPFLLFQQWKNDYGRLGYEILEEHENRFKVFKKNMDYIIEMNSKRKSPHSYRLGLNKFADISPEEFRKTYLNQIKMPSNYSNAKQGNHSCKHLPRSFDWREKGVVTAVKEQGHSSCWAFSGTGAIEGINAIVTGELMSLSEQVLIDCDENSPGCSGGCVDCAFEWIINNDGIYSEASYPYTMKNHKCQASKNRGNKALTIDGYVQVTPSDDAILCTSTKQPISVYLDSSDIQLYIDGIYDGGKCSNDPHQTDYSLLIVGYDSKGDHDYWIAKNSWGEDWGEHGYIRFKRNTGIPHGLCAINAWAFYPTKSK